ncbi:hypothetical protein EDB85DRAFT_2215685 [Lactarius pseudohatsudake]|nr:hypothetical protein EDB85DRAFT_2215685 [Lactarius pseudohatsudake]
MSTLNSLLLALSPDPSFKSSLLDPSLGLANLKVSESELSQGKPFPFLPASLEPIPRHSMPPQRPSGIKMFNLDSSPLKVTLASTPDSPTPFILQSQELPTVHEVSSMFAPPLTLSPPLQPSRFGLACNFALAIVIAAALVLTLINASKTISPFVCKLWNKKEDLSSSQNSAFKTSEPCNISVQQLQLRQLTPHASRFVFDPGGLASSSRLLLAHEDVHKPNDLIIFDPRGGAFVLESAHKDSAILDKDAW